jgi:hypothetical protein
MHSSTVRTLEPISRPVSQQAVMKLSIAVRVASASCCTTPAGGSSTSTSMSECGNSSPRP